MNFLECEMDTRISLRHLVLKDFIGRMWFISEFLNHLTELEHLRLEITNQTCWAQSRSGVTSPVYCERLTSLSLALGANMTGTRLINLLKVPCLARLEIYNSEDGQCEIAGAIDSLVGLVRRSSSHSENTRSPKRLHGRNLPLAVVGVGTGNSVAGYPRGGRRAVLHHHRSVVRLVDHQVRFSRHEAYPPATDRHKIPLRCQSLRKGSDADDRVEVYADAGWRISVVGKC